MDKGWVEGGGWGVEGGESLEGRDGGGGEVGNKYAVKEGVGGGGRGVKSPGNAR